MASAEVFYTEAELQERIRVEEARNVVKFVKQRKHVCASVDELSSLNGKRLRFTNDGHPSSGVEIRTEGIPFIIMNNEILECQQGPKHIKKLQVKDETRHCIRSTRKMNCPAQIRIRRIIQFPDYKINGTPTGRQKRQMSQRLKTEFSSNTVRRLVIYAVISGRDDHQNHPIGEVAGYIQSLDKKVISKIKELANSGHRNVGSVKVLLKDFVKEELAPDADEGNRRYFPTNNDIRSHIYQAVVGTNLQSAHDDQLKTAQMIEDMKKLHPNDNYFFRPASSDGESVASLLLVMQTAFQRRMLKKYGQEMVLMDATYKTTKYALPLYNICVQTNSGFHIVCSFFVSQDTLFCVSEALKIIQSWNPSWNPKNFMCDFDLREIGAIESTFPDAHVFLCNFHRDQAWQRWLTKNRISEKAEVLKQLRKVASSAEEKEYNMSLSAIQSTPLYKENTDFRNWFEKKWVQNAKRWVFFFRKHLMSVVSTTNGVERQHKELKHHYIKEFGIGKSLSNVVTIILEKFFPDAEISYKRANVMGRDDTRRYSADVPIFLQNRPKNFINHCLKRLPPNVQEIKEIVTKDVNEYQICSENTSDIHIVTIEDEKPKCSCEDFAKRNWPCKHILALCIKMNIHFLTYFQHPLFVLDSEILSQNAPENVDSSITEPSVSNIPAVQQPQASEESCRRPCLELLNTIENFLYNTSDVQVLESSRGKLNEVAKYLEENTVTITGLPIRKRKKWQRTSCRRISRKRKFPSASISEQPTSGSMNKTKKTGVTPTLPEQCVVTEEVVTPIEKELMAIWNSTPTDEIVLQLGPYNITRRSFHFLKTTLSDEVIDAYLSLLTKGTNVLHISSVIATAIFQGQGNLQNFLSRENFEMYDACLAAVNEGGHHWVLIIIQPQEKSIIYINPMGEMRAVCNQLQQFWCNFMNIRSANRCTSNQDQPTSWTVKTVTHSKQLDGLSCGIYVLKFAENFLSNTSFVLKWSKQDIFNERKRIALKIMECGLESHQVNQSHQSRSRVTDLKSHHNSVSSPQVKDLESHVVEKQTADIKPHILTHLIDGFVIEEGFEPFPTYLPGSDYGQNVDQVERLIRKQEAFDMLVKVQEDKLDTQQNHLLQMVQSQPFQVSKVQQSIDDVMTRRNPIKHHSSMRYGKLSDSILYTQFNRDVTKAERLIDKTQKVAIEDDFQDVTDLNEKMKKHKAFEAEIKATTEEVNKIKEKGNALLKKKHPESDTILRNMKRLMSKWDELLDVSNNRGKGSQEAEDILKFHEQVDKVETWIQDKEALVNAGDLGCDYEHCIALQKKVSDLESAGITVDTSRVKAINEQAEKLMSLGYTDNQAVKQRRNAMNQKWTDIQGGLDSYKQKLTSALEMHAFNRDVDDIDITIDEKAVLLSNEDLGKDLNTTDALQRKQEEEIERDMMKMSPTSARDKRNVMLTQCQVGRRSRRAVKPKEKRKSFVYPKVKRNARQFCICNSKNDGRRYWQCDVCEEWYHPECLNLDMALEPETFVCHKCKISDNKMVYKDGITREFCVSQLPRLRLQMYKMMTCDNTECEEPDHVRHHEFLTQPLAVYNRERFVHCFGQCAFTAELTEFLCTELAEKLLFLQTDPVHIYSGPRVRMLRDLPACPLKETFNLHHGIADSYVLNVLLKEVMVWLECSRSGAPYEKINITFAATEIDLKACRKELQ